MYSSTWSVACYSDVLADVLANVSLLLVVWSTCSTDSYTPSFSRHVLRVVFDKSSLYSVVSLAEL